MRARVLLAALWLGCSPPPQASSSDLGLVGCDRLDDRDGELDCELALGEEELRLWAPGDKPLVLLDGLVHAPLRAYERGGGWHLTLSVPRAARRLTVARAAADAQPMSFGSVNLRWPEDSTRVEELAPLFAAYQDARDADCHDLAVALFQRAHAERRWRRALLVATLGSACGIRQGDLEAIARWRSEAERVPAGPDGREMDRANLIALAHFHEGNFHAALTAIERGIEHALRFDMTSMHAQLLSLYSLALIETGDFAGAMTAAREALDGEEHPHLDRTSQVALRDNLAWAMIRQAERLGLRAPAEAERELLRALDAVEDPAYTGPLEYGSTLRLNLARLFLLVDRLPAVDQLLDAVAAEADSLGPKFQSELQLLRAQVRLAAHDYETADALLRAPGLEDGLFGDLQRELWMSRGESAEARGDLASARAYYHLVHRDTFDRAQRLAASEGLQRFVFDRRRAAQRLVRLLVEPLEDPRTALAIAREATGTDARLLSHRGVVGDERTQCLAAGHAYLSARDYHEHELLARWDLPERRRRQAILRVARAAQNHAELLLEVGESRRESPLRAVGPGELALLYFPLDARRLLAFAVTAGDIAVTSIDARTLPTRREVPLDEATLAAWSAALVAPFAPAIAEARRIRILPSLGLQVLPFHALPWRGQPLLFHAEVEYSLDLPPRSGVPRDPRDALVVGDPSGDLAGARIEAEAVGAHLTAQGLSVTMLVGRAADGPTVRAALPAVDHLHYAGHSTTAGERGWESVLQLASATTLTIPDILALEDVPRTVSLLSCSAGVAPPEPRSQGMTLTGAFLTAGSEAVVASSTPLRSSDAASFAAELYGAERTLVDFPARYRLAMLRLQGNLAPATWQALRLWVP